MIGIAHHSIHTALEAARRVVGEHRACAYVEGVPVVGCTLVVPGVRVVRARQSHIEGARVHVVVVDVLARLRTIDDIVLADADPADHAWNPRPIRMHVLRRCLTPIAGPHARVAWSERDVLADLVDEARRTGMLSAVLELARKLPDAAARDHLHAAVVDHLAGRTALTTLRRRTQPTRAALVVLHENMCRALASPAGLALSRATRLVRAGMDPLGAAAQTGADVFEVRYLLSKMVVKNHA